MEELEKETYGIVSISGMKPSSWLTMNTGRFSIQEEKSVRKWQPVSRRT